jgi:hypothetical protein
MHNHTYSECSHDWLRAVISGEIQFRKCPACDNKGIEYQVYDENGETCPSDAPTATRYKCEKCHGIAFIEIPSR